MAPNHVSSAILPFQIAGRQGGLFVSDVVEVIRAIAITPLPKAPLVIEGIINVRGQIAPVVDLRLCFGLSKRKLELTDRFILVRAGSRIMAMRVDETSAVAAIDNRQIDDASQGGLNNPAVAGIAKLKEGLILIYDVCSFLSVIETQELDRALAESAIS